MFSRIKLIPTHYYRALSQMLLSKHPILITLPSKAWKPYHLRGTCMAFCHRTLSLSISPVCYAISNPITSPKTLFWCFRQTRRRPHSCWYIGSSLFEMGRFSPQSWRNRALRGHVWGQSSRLLKMVATWAYWQSVRRGWAQLDEQLKPGGRSAHVAATFSALT